MRSRSTVLSHVLGSNPEICGYRELHVDYKGRAPFFKMKTVLYSELESNFKGKFLLDKLLHDNKHCDSLLEMGNAKIIFLLRSPEDTIKSILSMWDMTGKKMDDPYNKAMEYYCSRLNSLIQYAEKLKGNYYFVESDDLVQNTDEQLANLTKWLGLEIPLSKNYSSFKTTGKKMHGDPSDNIKSGVLQQTKKHTDIDVPEDILKKAEEAYQKCKAALES